MRHMGGAFASLARTCDGGGTAADDLERVAARIEASLLQQQERAHRELAAAVAGSVGQTMSAVDASVRAAVAEAERAAADSAVVHGTALSVKLEESAARSFQSAIEALAAHHRVEREEEGGRVLASLSSALSAAAESSQARAPRPQAMKRRGA